MLAAWMVAPGFYDGFGPAVPYNFVCPPPQQGPNLPPKSGHLDIKVIGGVSDADSAFTDDGQVVIGFLPGAFDATGKSTIAVDIKPVTPCPNPPGLHFVTNTYLITADAPLVKNSSTTLLYSNIAPAPSDVYFASSVDGPWKSIGATQQAQPFTINTTTSRLGYFSAGYSSNATPSPGSIRISGGQVLPIAVAILIVLVVVAGVPLAIVRRRRSGGDVEEDEEEDEDDA
jgi:hypothetical protein